MNDEEQPCTVRAALPAPFDRRRRAAAASLRQRTQAPRRCEARSLLSRRLLKRGLKGMREDALSAVGEQRAGEVGDRAAKRDSSRARLGHVELQDFRGPHLFFALDHQGEPLGG